MSTLVVLPSWSKLASDLESETGSKFAAFIRLGGRPLYKHIEDLHLNLPSPKFFAVVPPGVHDIQSKVSFDSRVQWIELLQSHSIGETVLAALKELKEQDSIVVNMADTLVSLKTELCFDVIYTQSRSDLYRWTSVVKRKDRTIYFPNDRDEDSIGDSQPVCVGLFTFYDGLSFFNILKAAVQNPKKDIDPFFEAIENYSKSRIVQLVEPERWFDCGHVDTYYEARLGYQNLRHFNSLAYESSKGQVTKTSEKVEQFRHQVRWFKQVPDSLTAFLPRIFESNDGDKPFITMELLSIPTLSDIFISRRMSPGAWNEVVRTIKYIVNEFSKYRFKSSLASELARSVYLNKTRSRINEFIECNPEALKYHIFYEDQRIDLSIVLSKLESFVNERGLLEIDELCPIHGDFCFSNLLYDQKARIVKLIDPRGEFGVPGIYGDPRYDMAKLAHSYSGGYDLLVSDQFDVDLSSSKEIKFENQLQPYHRQVKAIFESKLIPNIKIRRQIASIEALLFLSMLPLHADEPKRQLAMMATGLNLFAKAVKFEDT